MSSNNFGFALLEKKTLLLIGCAKNLPYDITIETFKQQKSIKSKFVTFINSDSVR